MPTASLQKLVARVLKTVVPIAIPAANLFLGEAAMDQWEIEKTLELIKESTGSLLSEELTELNLIASKMVY